MSLFLLLGPPFMTGDGPKMVHFGPKMAKHGRLVNVPKWSKRVQKGPKGSKMANLSVFDHLGPFWAHLDPFGPFQTKMNFLPQMGVAEVHIETVSYLGALWLLAI